MIVEQIELGRLLKSAPIHSGTSNSHSTSWNLSSVDVLPMDTWTKAIRSQDKFKTQMTCKSFKLVNFKSSDINVFERFYSNLCHLIQRIGHADPELLFVVQKVTHSILFYALLETVWTLKVKSLLENGGTLQRSLLSKIVQETKAFMMACGRAIYNNKLLPVFRFIARCVFVQDGELNQVKRQTIPQTDLSVQILKSAEIISEAMPEIPSSGSSSTVSCH